MAASSLCRRSLKSSLYSPIYCVWQDFSGFIFLKSLSCCSLEGAFFLDVAEAAVTRQVPTIPCPSSRHLMCDSATLRWRSQRAAEGQFVLETKMLSFHLS
ncbi:hypothetical protein FQN60_014240 [Etheostoma spectabile]|uniref:Uncharacterized protein n=1 Tax=Etheostoma spectabile TaxID=54343 RepID=A0A5J5DC10_9PERO|nr:hypothetical protein FQN60_014240 [Etheostoma spectabile]